MESVPPQTHIRTRSRLSQESRSHPGRGTSDQASKHSEGKRRAAHQLLNNKPTTLQQQSLQRNRTHLDFDANGNPVVKGHHNDARSPPRRMDFNSPVKRPAASGSGNTNSMFGKIKSYWGGIGQQQENSNSGGFGPSESHSQRCDKKDQGSNKPPNTRDHSSQTLETAPAPKGERQILGEIGSSPPLKREAEKRASALMEEIGHRDQRLQRQERHLSKLEKQLEAYKHQLQQKERQNAKLEMNVDECERHLGNMQVERQDLIRNLEACKDRIFNTQPFQGPSDSELASWYKDICNDIDYWVENHFGDTGNLITRIVTAEDARGHKIFVKRYLHKNNLEAVAWNPETNLSMLSSVISRHLHVSLFSPGVIFPGLDSETQLIFREIVDNMGALKPEKDAEALQIWRVDLQRTLNLLPPVKLRCENALAEISDTISTCLQALRGMGNRESLEYSQCRQFVQQAFELANNIRQSVELYSFDFKCPLGTVAEPRVLRLDDLKYYNVIDSRTGMALRSSANPIPGPDGRVGEALFDVHPEFVRQSTGSTQKIVLVKATIVVRFDQEVPRGGKKNASG